MKVAPSRIVSDKSGLQAETIVVEEGVMGPGHGRAGGQQNEGIEKREVPRIEGFDALRRPNSAGEFGP